MGSRRIHSVEAGCAKKGLSFYRAAIGLNGRQTTLSTVVRPNDLISLSASQTPSTTSATFTDDTTGFTDTLTATGATSFEAFIGSEVADGSSPLKDPVFATFAFTNVHVDGADLGTYFGSSDLGEYIQTHFRKIIIQPGNLGANDFTLTRMP